MLVLSRKSTESVQVLVPPSDKPQVVTVSVVRSTGRVKLGIAADPRITVLRSELQKD